MKNMNVCVCLILLNFSDRNIPKITRIGKKKNNDAKHKVDAKAQKPTF